MDYVALKTGFFFTFESLATQTRIFLALQKTKVCYWYVFLQRLILDRARIVILGQEIVCKVRVAV